MSAVGVTLIGSVIFALHLNAVAFDVGLSIFGGIGNVNGNGYGSREHPSNYWFDFLLFYSTKSEQNRIGFCSLFLCSRGLWRGAPAARVRLPVAFVNADARGKMICSRPVSGGIIAPPFGSVGGRASIIA